MKRINFPSSWLISLGTLLCFSLVLSSCQAQSTKTEIIENKTEEAKKEIPKSVDEDERSQATKFLIAEANFTDTFPSDKTKFHGVIRNTSTVASFKNALVKLTFYGMTKTGTGSSAKTIFTELGSKEYTIYENFPPQSEVKFELDIENYDDVSTFELELLEAISN